MALTGIADTRLLITLQFPPDEETKKRVEVFLNKELARRLLAPSIVLTEFIRVAGPRIGENAALVRLSLLKERGMRIAPLDERASITAGKLLLAHQNAPIADALIASFVKLGEADYVITDDPHYRDLGVHTRWI
ncbi:MAG: PIN domain-containing protein [Nitrososphaerales archaeon]